ncbi:hypothetical protein [Acidovorax sp. A1169]|uniref:hypothetical protein n=1 Tax=Acidovorax sp. A1169 TaxID=3059524 RepID=UPI002738021F|nr:hypothetical protein [Acidovorax sp. A1169]MDP4075099.1 hypothetical protein [Acidovorax sp. A1169]
MKMPGTALRVGLFCTQAALAAAYCGRFEFGLRGIVVPQNGLPTPAQGKRYARSS